MQTLDVIDERVDPMIERTESEISIPRIMRVISRYRYGIVLSLLTVAIAWAVIASASYVFSPHTRVTSLPFRFDFDGSTRGVYPNGMKFNTADVIAAPVLQSVFAADQIGRYIGYDDFARSVFVVEFNREYDRIASEYQSRLGDQKLTSVDRERITNEYELKLASVQKSNFALNFVCQAGSGCPPGTMVNKALTDTLRTWAAQAVAEKRVLLYRAPMLSVTALSNSVATPNQRALSLLVLRLRVLDVQHSIDYLARVPAAELIRTGHEQISYPEIRLQLNDLLRFRLEPMIENELTNERGLPEIQRAVQAQLQFDQLQLDGARLGQKALADSLAAYESSTRTPRENTPAERSQKTPSGETVILSDTFLDRLIGLTSGSADRDYRQKLVDDMKQAALSTIPYETAVAYDEKLVAYLNHPALPASPINAATFQTQFQQIYGGIANAIRQLEEIHRLLSKQMFAESLYSSAGPTTTHIERAVSPTRLFLIGIIVIGLSLPIIVAACAIHDQTKSLKA